MVRDYSRVGGLYPEMFREVEPVSPYPRVTPQQQRQEGYSRQRQQAEPEQERQQRRFTAMRRMIDRIKGAVRIIRVEFGVAETELQDRGLAVLEEQLIDELLQLKLSLPAIDELLQQIRQNSQLVNFGAGATISHDEPGLLPVSTRGLQEFNLHIGELIIRGSDQNRALLQEIDKTGRFVREAGPLRLICKRLGPELSPQEQLLQLDIVVQVAVIEVDPAGRRAILYPRSESVYCLYADKQINLSI